jgi:hypothetical protein
MVVVSTDTITAKATADMTPVEVDTELSRIWGKLFTARQAVKDIKKRMKAVYTYGAKKGLPMYDQADLAERLAKAEALIEEFEAEAAPFEAEYSLRPWKRYFLVTNANGHVHRGMNCSTCFPTTEYAWLIDLADCDEAAMVNDYGEKACTVCFPDAPTFPAFAGPGRLDREAQAAKDAEKAAKAAAKNAKLLVEPVRIHHTSWKITTIASAKQEIRDAIRYTAWYGDADGKRAADIETLTAALLAKGIEQAEIDTLVQRATKAARKDRS